MPLREGVYQILRSSIVEGDLAPGEHLAEQQLAAELGVSRTPVREALRRLALEGFVVMVPRRGAYVAGLSLKDMNDLFELRMALEGLAAYLAAQRITPAEITGLRQSICGLETAIVAGDREQVIAADTSFHSVIYSSSRNRRLITIVGNLSDQIQAFRLRSLFSPGRLKDTVREHKQLVLALEREKQRRGRGSWLKDIFAKQRSACSGIRNR
jgi:DNA-binding GntR family transcriptional regulator